MTMITSACVLISHITLLHSLIKIKPLLIKCFKVTCIQHPLTVFLHNKCRTQILCFLCSSDSDLHLYACWSYCLLASLIVLLKDPFHSLRCCSVASHCFSVMLLCLANLQYFNGSTLMLFVFYKPYFLFFIFILSLSCSLLLGFSSLSHTSDTVCHYCKSFRGTNVTFGNATLIPRLNRLLPLWGFPCLSCKLSKMWCSYHDWTDYSQCGAYANNNMMEKVGYSEKVFWLGKLLRCMGFNDLRQVFIALGQTLESFCNWGKSEQAPH